MTKRVSLPGASELFFRSTTSVGLNDGPPVGGGGTPEGPAPMPRGGEDAERDGQPEASGNGARRGSPRKKHDAKITVYVSREELLAIEHARLALRGTHHLAVDRGRLVREAVAVLLQDFEEHGEESVLVRRLRTDEGGSFAAGDEPG